MIADRRPQTGPSAVTLADLLQLPKDYLQAMASNKVPSIAPPYLTLAALSAVTKQQMGIQQPLPATTIKDRVIAQATPPIAAGIGGIGAQRPEYAAARQPIQSGVAPAAPPQTFAGGGSVQYGGQYGGKNLLPDTTGYEGMPIGEVLADVFSKIKQGDAGADAWLRAKLGGNPATAPTAPTNPNYSHEEKRIPNLPTSPREMVYSGRSTGVGGPTAQQLPQSVSGSASSSRRVSGIGGTGARNPFVEYSQNKIAPKSLSDIAVESAPEDQYLTAALAKYGKPDEARMDELRRAEDVAGLTAFGAAMVDPSRRGFGAAFAPAAKAGFAAQEGMAKDRREYQDKRDMLALELGLKKGTKEYDEWKRQQDAKKSERAFDITLQEHAQKRGDTQIDKKNEFYLKQLELDIRAAANRIAEQARLDGRHDRYVAALAKLKEDAYATASKAAMEKHGKVDPISGKLMDPDGPRKIGDDTKVIFGQLFGPELQQALDRALQKEVGIKSPSVATPQTSGRMYRSEIK